MLIQRDKWTQSLLSLSIFYFHSKLKAHSKTIMQFQKIDKCAKGVITTEEIHPIYISLQKNSAQKKKFSLKIIITCMNNTMKKMWNVIVPSTYVLCEYSSEAQINYS